MSSSGMGWDVHSLMLSNQHFLCRPPHLPPSKGALKDELECDMFEPCKFPSLDSGQKKFLWTRKEADLAPHPVVGLVLQVGGAEK